MTRELVDAITAVEAEKLREGMSAEDAERLGQAHAAVRASLALDDGYQDFLTLSAYRMLD